MNIALIIFTKNEEEIIECVLKEVLEQTQKIISHNFQLYLWDDSNDQTCEQAQKYPVTIKRGKNRGLGLSYYHAMHFFAQKNQQEQFDIIVTMDGDGQVDVRELPRFIEPIIDGSFDMVVGSRFKDQNNQSIKYSYPWINFFGVKLLSLIITLGSFQKLTDSHGGLRAMRTDVVLNFKFLGIHSYVQETIIDAKARKHKILEIPSVWFERKWGESRVVRSPFMYAKRMLIPLLLRVHFHIVVGAFVSLTSPVLGIAFILGTITYRHILFQRNEKKSFSC